ncbi:sugar ABC transporter permease [Clostridium thermosuccinogenes]|uniref:Sugar ABC transporter permease n=2 Tax=Clostridium thermosuccinogenes TaxID=84032 RepID=A0A2K2FG15_9CLOT|nr:sugar ABC transporter permease [Pseudoclostridium thermosuccinogenes]AUS97041.1 sugar ABC transporter permease [Pseudoclostridium thermosuccinogenes]PNT96085.1 sugar ABC transporter permease [Pseudoclostridium thermosuccinogenes]PNT97696.1 sugar ABC transporter permease [Pseudoclostridium thermosuccinogenes]
MKSIKGAVSGSEKKPISLLKWLRSDKGQRLLVILTFSFVPVLLLLVFTYIPFSKMVQFSFYDMKYIGKREFVGLKNYQEIFTRKDIFSALKLSLYYMGASFVQLALALYFATLLSFKTKGGNFFKGAIFFPYLVSGIAVGFMFKFFFTRGFVFDSILSWIGISIDSLPYWLQDTAVNNIALAGTSVWRYMGQNMTLFIGAIQSVDPQLYESAKLDGAGKWQQFRYIILPSIKTIVVLNMILSISGSLSAFEPPYVITGGTFGTATYFLMMHKIAHEYQKVGLASAMAIVLFAMIILVTVIQQLISKALNDGDENFGAKTRKSLIKGVKGVSM